jgi:hypothetical protein
MTIDDQDVEYPAFCGTTKTNTSAATTSDTASTPSQEPSSKPVLAVAGDHHEYLRQ